MQSKLYNFIKFFFIGLALNTNTISLFANDETPAEFENLSRRARESKYYADLMVFHAQKIQEFAVKHKLTTAQVCTLLTCLEYGATSDKALSVICKNKKIVDQFKEFYVKNDLKRTAAQLKYGIMNDRITPKNVQDQRMLAAMKKNFSLFEQVKNRGIGQQNSGAIHLRMGQLTEKYNHIIDSLADDNFHSWLNVMAGQDKLNHKLVDITDNSQLQTYYEDIYFQKITQQLHMAGRKIKNVNELSDAKFLEMVKNAIRMITRPSAI